MSRLTLVTALTLLLFGCGRDTDADDDGYVAELDCNDDDASVNPGAAEVCDDVDNNCDGVVDAGATDGTTYFSDIDGDGHGNALLSEVACSAPEGLVELGDDCDDANADIHPGATEDDCTDPVDYNCDGSVGYDDADGDGFAACEDCDDSLGTINPNAIEVCDDIDNNCDAEVDELGAIGGTTFYADTDADTFGDADATTSACDAPDGFVANAKDCDDSNSAVNPSAAEVCNEVDDNCNDLVDDDATDATVWYADSDGDGSGGSQFTIEACAQPSGYLASSDDCNDLDAKVYPGATEACDGADSDCDGTLPTDESDADGDGFMACDLDCDDANADVYTGAIETCNDVDDNCNGYTDDGAVDKAFFYLDSDGDGDGHPVLTVEACKAPSGYSSTNGDCNDSSVTINSFADDICDAIDNDCDGQADNDPSFFKSWYVDSDADGFGASGDSVDACFSSGGRVDNTGDCDDSSDLINPDAAEQPGNGADETCDGNDAPGAPGITLTNAPIAEEDDVFCEITTPSVDTDGDSVTYTVTWYLDGSPWNGATLDTDETGDTIPAEETESDQVWTCEVQADDGIEDGGIASADVTITNNLQGICGPNLHVDPVQSKPGWTMCYVKGSDAPEIRSAACNTLFDSTGKTYGCWHGTCEYPHQNCNGVVDNACRPNVQNTTRYNSWSGTNHVLGICIQN